MLGLIKMGWANQARISKSRSGEKNGEPTTIFGLVMIFLFNFFLIVFGLVVGLFILAFVVVIFLILLAVLL